MPRAPWPDALRQPLSGETRLVVVRVASCAGLLGVLLVGRRAFLPHDLLAPLPAWGDFALPRAVSLAAFGLLLALLVAAALRPRSGALALAAAGALVLRGAWDLLLWQPYLLEMGAILAFTAARARSALDACRVAVAGVYLWSGLSKLDHSFVVGGGAEATFPALSAIPEGARPWVALLAPLGEMAIAAGLLVPRSRVVAAWAAASMHAVILLLIGPLGTGYNAVVWPWNIASMVLVLVLFLGSGETAREVLRPRRSLAHGAALALFLVLPGLSHVGAWPVALSFRLYSYRVPQAAAWVTPEGRDALPAGARKYLHDHVQGRHVAYLRPSEWALGELGVVLPPSRLAHRKLYSRLCPFVARDEDLVLVLEDPPDALSGGVTAHQMSCGNAAGR